MELTDAIVIAVIVLIIGLAIFYIVKAKLNGQKCIGCPHSKTCNSNSSKNSHCSCSNGESHCSCGGNE